MYNVLLGRHDPLVEVIGKMNPKVRLHYWVTWGLSIISLLSTRNCVLRGEFR